MQNYTDNANGDVPLAVENDEITMHAHVFLGRKTKLINRLLYKKYFKIYINLLEIPCKNVINQSIYQIAVMLKMTFKRF